MKKVVSVLSVLSFMFAMAVSAYADQLDGHAEYDSTTKILTIPYLDVPLIDPISQQPIPDQYGVYACQMEYVPNSGGSFSFKVPITYLPNESGSDTHAKYNYDGTLSIPYADVQTVVVLPFNNIVPGPVETYKVILKQLMLDDAYFHLQSAVNVNQPSLTDEPQLSGDTEAQEGQEIEITINNFSTTAQYTITLNGATLTHDNGVIKWTAPDVNMDTVFEFQVTAIESGHGPSEVVKHILMVKDTIISVIAIDAMEYADDAALQATYVTSTLGKSGTYDFFGDSSGVSLYRLNSNANDESGTNNGTPTDLTYTTSNAFGCCGAVFNGTSSNISGLPSLSGAFSVSFWLYVDSLASNQGLMGNSGASSTLCNVYLTAEPSIYFTFNGTTAYFFSNTLSFSAGEWVNIVFTRDGSDNFKVYENGSLNLTRASTTGSFDISTKFGSSNEGYMSGYFAQVRIFNRELNSAEVAQIAAEGSIQSYSTTNLTQGSNALEIQATSGALGEYVERTISPAFNLSGKSTIKMDVQADVTGTNLRASIHDSDGKTTTKDLTISVTNTTETIEWDISGVADADKDAIDRLRFEAIESEIESFGIGEYASLGSTYSGYEEDSGVAFTLSSAKRIEAVEFYIYKQGSPTGNIQAFLYDSTGTVGTDALPTGSALASSNTVDVSALGISDPEIVRFTFPKYSATAGDYCVLFRYTGGDGSNKIFKGRGGGATGMNSFISNTAGTDWTYEANDFIFYLYTSSEATTTVDNVRAL